MKRIVLTLAAIAALASCTLNESQLKPVTVEYFKNGDTLLPDYVCSDTLIVWDAKGLNEDLSAYNQGFLDGGDAELDEIDHRHASHIEAVRQEREMYRSQFEALQRLTPGADSLTIDLMIKED